MTPDRQLPPPARPAWTTSATAWLIVANVAVFVLQWLFFAPRGERVVVGGVLYERVVPSPLEAWGAFTYDGAIRRAQLWRFVTFQFLHGNLVHLLFNAFSLHLFGPVVERALGRPRYLAFFLLCGVAGPLALLAAMAVKWVDPRAQMVGASAGAFGVLLAAAYVAPREWVQLLFPPIPVRLRTFAYGMLAFAALVVLSRGGAADPAKANVGGEAAHLGGAILGFWLIRHPQSLDWAETLAGRPRLKLRY